VTLLHGSVYCRDRAVDDITSVIGVFLLIGEFYEPKLYSLHNYH